MNVLQPTVLPCGRQVHNRFFKSAMSEGMGDRDHNPSETLLLLYEKWAKQQIGIIVTGNVMV
ncbi:MAG: hypothetical protein ACRC5C_08465, partial [Bacilli bacterium]